MGQNSGFVSIIILILLMVAFIFLGTIYVSRVGGRDYPEDRESPFPPAVAPNRGPLPPETPTVSESHEGEIKIK